MSLAKLSLPLVLMGPLLGAAAGAGGSYMVTQERVAALGATAVTNTTKISELEKGSAETRAQVTEVRTDMKHVLHALDRLETKLGTKK